MNNAKVDFGNVSLTNELSSRPVRSAGTCGSLEVCALCPPGLPNHFARRREESCFPRLITLLQETLNPSCF
jgi:hypothetical protein